MTNLINRYVFDKKLLAAIKHADKKQTILAILCLDVDKLKEINDTYGRHVGNLLLQKLSDRVLRELPEKYTTVARFGGDEFIVMLENVTDTEDVRLVAQRICTAITNSFEIEDVKMIVTISMGISIYPFDGRDSENLLRNVDKAIEIAQQQNGNSFHFNTDPITMKMTLNANLKN